MQADFDDFLLAKGPAHALVAYIVKKYSELGERDLGRTILQKLCYFAEAKGIPLEFRFGVYHYGPFSQEIFDVTENLLIDDVIKDVSDDPRRSKYVPGSSCEVLLKKFEKPVRKYKNQMDSVVQTFSKLDPTQIELVSTIHYIHSSYCGWDKGRPSKEQVVAAVLDIKKEKFHEQFIRRVYDILQTAGLLE